MSVINNISIRSNFYLWLLTGRSAGFANAALNTLINYIVKFTPAEVTYARQFLRLDETDNDFHVLSIYAASLMSKAMLRDMPDNVDAVFAPGLLALPQIVSSAPLLGSTGHAFGYVDGAAAGAGGFTQVTFTRVTDTKVKIETDSGLSETCASTLVELDGGDFRLSVENASKYGVFADFQMSQWLDDDYVSVSLAPTRYPYASMVDKLRKDRTMMRLMNAEGTLATFESSPANPALQVGMAGLAIIRRMLKWTDDSQAGFEVSLESSDDLREPLATFYTVTHTMVDLDEVPVDPVNPVGFDV